jgi:hypothetical protein
MDKEKIQSALEGIQREIPGCSVAIAARFKDSSLIASVNKMPGFDTKTAATSGTRSISTAMKAIHILNPKLHAEESLVTGERVHFLIRMYPDKGVWLGLALSLDANLGMARVAIKKYHDLFYQNL